MIEPLVNAYSFLTGITSCLPLPVQAFYNLVLVFMVISALLRAVWTLRG